MAIARKVAVTVALGGLTYFLTNLTNQPQASAITLSVLIGGVALLVQFLTDVDERQRAVERRLDDLGKAHFDLVERTERGIRDQLATISDATRLFDLLQRSTLNKESIAGLVALSAQVRTATPDLVRSLTQAQVDRTSLFLDQLIRGAELTYEGEDRDWLLALTQLAKNSIDGTTAAGLAFWNSELGTRYLEYQRQAISRGVAVRRVFMLEAASPSAAIRRAC